MGKSLQKIKSNPATEQLLQHVALLSRWKRRAVGGLSLVPLEEEVARTPPNFNLLALEDNRKYSRWV